MMFSYSPPAGPGSFAGAEVVLVVACAGLSLGLFLRQLGPIARRILTARPDPGFRLRPLQPRLLRLAIEVFGQRKVIRERPLVGMAHAVVFWAFCAFALVTVHHLTLVFGRGFLLTGWFSRGVFLLAEGFAVLCLLAITGLTARRFLLRPRWLGARLSWGSALVAFLIALLMGSYLAVFYVTDAGRAAHGLWWLHTLVLMIFLPVVPRTKHLHLLLAPLSLFFADERLARIPALSGEEDFGLLAGRDVSRIAALQAFSCVECGRCMEHCPAVASGKDLNPKELVLGLQEYLQRNDAAAEIPLVGAVHPLHAIFECTSCAACQQQCPVGVEHLPLIVGLRRGVVNTGEWQHKQGARLFLNRERTGNPLGRPQSERERWIERAAFPLFDGSQQYCLWLGCMGSYDPRGQQIVLALASVLQTVGISFGVLRREQCTGDTARRLGNDLLFSQLAQANLTALRAAGVKRMVSICPHCVQTIAEDWREFGDVPAIEHHSELLARILPELSASGNSEKASAMVYHDPCYLARYRGVTEAPRRIVAAAGHLLEAERNRQHSFCCGAGGGQFFLGEEQGERIGRLRAEQLAATGATTVAAACPFCAGMLGDAFKTMGEPAPQLVDVAELVQRQLQH